MEYRWRTAGGVSGHWGRNVFGTCRLLVELEMPGCRGPPGTCHGRYPKSLDRRVCDSRLRAGEGADAEFLCQPARLSTRRGHVDHKTARARGSRNDDKPIGHFALPVTQDAGGGNGVTGKGGCRWHDSAWHTDGVPADTDSLHPGGSAGGRATGASAGGAGARQHAGGRAQRQSARSLGAQDVPRTTGSTSPIESWRVAEISTPIPMSPPARRYRSAPRRK